MKVRKSVVVWLLIVVLAVFGTMAFVPMPAQRLQEGGPVLSEVQLVYVGIIASALLWVLRLLAARGYQLKKEMVAIALYVISFVAAIVFTPVALPPFPPFTDAPSFVSAVLNYGTQILAITAPVVGMAYLVYNILLKRVLESIASRVRRSLRSTALPTADVAVLNVRAKFKVIEITQHEYSGKTIKLGAQYDQSIPEDRRFAQATPSGELKMYVNNPPAANAFKIGRYVYLDFTPAE